MKKAFFFDVDGTIVDNTRNHPYVSDKTKYALKELSTENYVFIASGRPLCLFEDDVLQLDVSGFITCNGGYCIMGNQIVSTSPFDPKTIDEIRDYCLKQGLIAFFETDKHVYVSDYNSKIAQAFMKSWGRFESYAQEKEHMTYYMAMVASEDEEGAIAFEKAFDQKLDVRRQYGYRCYDIGLWGVNKGYGVQQTLKYLNVDPKNAYAFGDGLNDLEMIEGVGHGVCMENGFPLVKEKASDIAKDILEDGVYWYLVENGLIKPMD